MTETATNLDLVHALVSYLPPAVARAIHADPRPLDGPRAARFPAAVLLADVSGFTALTGDLATLGATGVEELTSLVNRYFARMIGLLEAAGGEVVQFSGDALIATFPAPRPAELPAAVACAEGAARAMQAAMAEFAALETSLGPRELAMKIGIGAGEVLAMSVGGEHQRWQYIIAGDPLRQVGEAEHVARRGDIILSPEARDLLAAAPARAPAARAPALDWSAADAAALEALRLHIPRAITARLLNGHERWLAELRRLSVVFIGVGGLEDHGGDEDVQRFQSYMRALQQTTYRYEGSINKFQVDDKGVIGIILFGAPPLAHSDDPLRAVRCALDLQRDAAAAGLRLAVGITTDQVFAGPVGSPSRREYTVMGDAVNLAARLMQAAGAGGVFCDHATYGAARAELIWDELPPLTLKGKAAPVRAYRPLGLASAEEARSAREGRAAGQPIVGRGPELAQMAAALADVAAGASRLLFIEGEEGIGKSRLVGELGAMMRARGLSGLLGTAQALSRDTPYNAWREIFGSYFDLDRLRDGAARRAQLLARVEQIAPELIERAPLLNDLLDLALPESDLTASLEPEQRQASLTALLVELLRLWAAEQPLVIVLEDAHWLDPLSWDLAALVARALADAPLLLACAARPDEAAAAGPARELRALARTTLIELGPLGGEEAGRLAAARLGVGRLDERLGELIAQRAAGSPLVIEELALSLRESPALTVVDETAGLRGDPEDLQLPATLQSLVLSRIDHLPEAEQLTLKVAAAIGASFSQAALCDVYPEPVAAATIAGHLAALAARELIVPLGESALATHRFRQAVLQEMTYSTLLPTQRRDLHGRVAAWYEGRPADSLPGLYPQLVHHWRQAGNSPKELRYAGLAGRKFAAEYANAAALSYLDRALQLESAAAGRRELLWLRLQIHERTGERAAQSADLEQIAGLIGADDRVGQARLANARAAYWCALSDYPAALEQLRQARAAARAAGDLASEARSLTLWGEVLEIQGDLAAARDYFTQALASYRQLGYRRGEANNLHRLGNLRYYQGDFAEARELFLQVLALRRAGHDADECVTLSNLGEVAIKQGDWEAGRAYWEQALAAARRVGNRAVEGQVLGQIGYGQLAQGRYAAALAQLNRSVQIFQVIGERRREAAMLNELGMLYRDIGDGANARRAFERALASQRAIGDAPNAAFTALNLGRLLIADDPARARELYQGALDYALESGELETEAYARSYLAYLAEQQGRWDEAAAGYGAALALREQVEARAAAAEELAGLARVALGRGDLAAAEAHARAGLAAMAEAGVDGMEFPLQFFLSCYDVMRALGPGHAPAADWLLDEARSLLMERAESIDDPAIRAAMIERVELHRRILALRPG